MPQMTKQNKVGDEDDNIENPRIVSDDDKQMMDEDDIDSDTLRQL